MKNTLIKKLLIPVFLLLFSQNSWSQNPENWTASQLIEPSTLAQIIKTGKDIPVIISVGPGAVIPQSVNIGMTNDKANIEKLKTKLNSLPKQTKIVLYCGCCPFEHCPNVRPAIEVLKEMKFTSYELLNLPHNVKTDWIEKGYPVEKQ